MKISVNICLEAIVSFEPTRYDVREGDGRIELTLALSQEVPFNTSLELKYVVDNPDNPPTTS